MKKRKKNGIYILGYSGLDNSLEFKKNEFPNFSEEEIRICQGMDAAAAIIKDGQIIAATEEERFNNDKHSQKFPINSINYCLSVAGITIEEVNCITHGFNYQNYKKFFQYDEYNKKIYDLVYSPKVQIGLLKKYLNIQSPKGIFVPVKHHDAHAASSYYPSGFSSALVVVADGMGELNSISVYKGKNNKLQLLKEYSYLSSLGMLYSMITHHLGFKVNGDEYKVMGLAPYGDYRTYLTPFSKCIDFRDKGEIFIKLLLENKSLIEKESYRGVKKWLNDNMISARAPQEPLEQRHKDVAATLQYILNKAMLHIITYWKEQTDCNKLCLAGGVALNCTANGEILRRNLFEDIYIQAAAGDDGVSVGSALYQYYKLKPRAKRVRENMPFYGYEITTSETKKVLRKYKKYIVYKRYSENMLLEKVAALIQSGKVIAWAQGKMEFGPRALGHRSILADSRSSIMKDLINKMVKKREAFRPFAPSVIEEKASQYYDVINSSSLPYMLFSVGVKKKYAALLPATTHINNSARIQTVNKGNNNRYWKLLKEFERKTSYPILLNTSFNVANQAIVRTEEDALKTFLATEIHALAIDDFLVFRK